MMPLIVILVPLLFALTLLLRPLAGRRLHLLPLAALPALLYSAFGDQGDTLVIRSVILKSHLGLQYTGAVVLFFTAGLWTIAAWFAVGYLKEDIKTRRFCIFWLLALCGNLGIVLAGDVPTFYTCFALMSFSAYGLVVHTEMPGAWRAGRVYIIMAVAGEAILLGALLLTVSQAESYLLKDAGAAVSESPHRNLILALAITGFGIKAGVFPLHFWLPLAHPAAPAPASSVLSGAMIKAGLLGWMHLLPGGHGEFPQWSIVIVCLGLITTFYGVTCGLPQRNPKTVLAYSSISQMGVMLLVAGVGLANPDAWPATLTLLAVYALNHGFCKGSLFLGIGMCGVWAGAKSKVRRWILAGLTVPALAIAGAPLMGGAIVKYAVKGAAQDAPPLLAPWLLILLPLSAVATTLLLGRFLLLARRQLTEKESPAEAKGDARTWAWIFSIIASVFAVHFSIPWFALEMQTAEQSLAGTWESLWPILTGGALLAILIALRRKLTITVNIPQGDLIVPLSRGFAAFQQRWLQGIAHPERWRGNFVPAIERTLQSPHVQNLITSAEVAFNRRETAAIFILLLLSLLWLLL